MVVVIFVVFVFVVFVDVAVIVMVNVVVFLVVVFIFVVDVIVVLIMVIIFGIVVIAVVVLVFILLTVLAGRSVVVATLVAVIGFVTFEWLWGLQPAPAYSHPAQLGQFMSTKEYASAHASASSEKSWWADRWMRASQVADSSSNVHKVLQPSDCGVGFCSFAGHPKL